MCVSEALPVRATWREKAGSEVRERWGKTTRDDGGEDLGEEKKGP